MDNSSYGEWNPFAVKVEGQYGLDAEMIGHEEFYISILEIIKYIKYY